MERLSVKIPRELKESLIATARARKTSQAAIVREALEFYLKQDKSKPFVSCFDLASDLAGSCEGPEDLATNKKYMKGYGR